MLTLQLALRSLRNRRLTTILTIMSIALSVSLLVGAGPELSPLVLVDGSVVSGSVDSWPLSPVVFVVPALSTDPHWDAASKNADASIFAMIVSCHEVAGMVKQPNRTQDGPLGSWRRGRRRPEERYATNRCVDQLRRRTLPLPPGARAPGAAVTPRGAAVRAASPSLGMITGRVW